ncbi:hypothetical protein [Reichenbachiella sp.]|uniref:hypothetical protein n=1 Tax=Reichenbachiella sp. TaxID=2184521 RepID=UPI003BB0471B
MDSKQIMFYQVYAALGGKGLDKAVSAYKQVFSEEVENLRDSTIQQYCKNFLYSDEGREQMKKYRADNVVVAEQLLDQLKDLRAMLPQEKVRDELEIRKEIRHTLRELGGLTSQVPEFGAEEDIYQFTDFVNVIAPLGVTTELIDRYLRATKTGKGQLLYFKDGQMIEMNPYLFKSKKGDLTIDQIYEQLSQGTFTIAFKKEL